jgi:ABC-2 type transport system ATP-binding protein
MLLLSRKGMSAINVKDLIKTYSNTEALKGVSLDVEEGEFFGLLGPNGAGKTTLIGILTGLVNKSSGEAMLFSKDVVNNYQEARALIGLVPQEFNFDIFEQVYNILYYNAGYFGMPSKARAPRIEEILKALGLWEKRNCLEG